MNALFTATLLAVCFDGPNPIGGGWETNGQPEVVTPTPTPLVETKFEPRSGLQLPLIGRLRHLSYFYQASEEKTFEIQISNTEVDCRIRQTLSELNYTRIRSVHRPGKKLKSIGTIVETYLGNAFCLECFLPTNPFQIPELTVCWWPIEGVSFRLGNKNGLSLVVFAP